MKNRTFSEYWITAQWFGPSWLSEVDKYFETKKMCRNAYNAGLRQGKKKRPRAVKQ